mmetsp:Transcript_40400/g.120515  ORF Transcript_40400/g.120515 Transcript_40400/m.120515 type:complete len:206 (-) Transcript_40400:117-734(-)
MELRSMFSTANTTRLDLFLWFPPSSCAAHAAPSRGLTTPPFPAQPFHPVPFMPPMASHSSPISRLSTLCFSPLPWSPTPCISSLSTPFQPLLLPLHLPLRTLQCASTLALWRAHRNAPCAASFLPFPSPRETATPPSPPPLSPSLPPKKTHSKTTLLSPQQTHAPRACVCCPISPGIRSICCPLSPGIRNLMPKLRTPQFLNPRP